jgi:transcriptional regulator with XRE-family HTH domain
MDEVVLKLKTYRTSRGWSQEHLARNLGVSLQTVHRWEAGKSAPSQLAQGRLTEFLGTQEQYRLL